MYSANMTRREMVSTGFPPFKNFVFLILFKKKKLCFCRCLPSSVFNVVVAIFDWLSFFVCFNFFTFTSWQLASFFSQFVSFPRNRVFRGKWEGFFFWNLKKTIPVDSGGILFFLTFFFPNGKKLNRDTVHWMEMLSVLLLLKSNKIPNKFHSFKKGKKRRDQTEQVASGGRGE